MTIYLTPEGKQNLDKELENLLAKRPEAARRIEKAKDQGDLKENAEYHDAKDSQGMMEARIRDVEATLKQAEVVEKNKDSDTVGLGSKITVIINDAEREYIIVGADEANPIEHKISNNSPLGTAFMGRKKSDTVEVEVPAGKMEYKIKNIE